MKIKFERINSELQKQISKIIAEEIKDPRLQGVLTSVTKVSTTPDLKYATVYVSLFSADKDKCAEAFGVIKSASVFIRNMLKDRVKVRLLPELNFVLDETEERSAKIDELLAEIKRQDELNAKDKKDEE